MLVTIPFTWLILKLEVEFLAIMLASKLLVGLASQRGGRLFASVSHFVMRLIASLDNTLLFRRAITSLRRSNCHPYLLETLVSWSLRTIAYGRESAGRKEA